MNGTNNILYQIVINNLKTIIVLIIYIIGASICYSHLHSIDSIELFTTSNTGLFILLFFITAIMISFLSLFFAIPYFSNNFLDIDNSKIDSISFRRINHRMSSINIILSLFIIAGVMFIISFYSLHKELKNSQNYLLIENIMVHIIIIIIPLLIFSLSTNVWYYKFIKNNSNSISNKSDILFTYVFHVVAIPNTFFIIWFIFSTFFGIDSPRDIYEIPIFVIYFFIISAIYSIPIEKVELPTKEKAYRTIILSILCIIMMVFCSCFLKTNLTDNLMKLIGKSDKKDYPYIIHNRYRYGLPKMSNNIYCGRALWRDENVIVFLPIGEDDKKKKRLIIDKKYIYPLQGEKRLTYCNK